MHKEDVLFSIQASTVQVPEHLRFAGGCGPCDIEAADKKDGKKLRRFKMRAYNGGPMNVGFMDPVVVDLTGMEVSAKQRPILKDHNAATPVGHTEAKSGKGNGITIGEDFIDAEGVFSVIDANSELIITSSDNGMMWQASIGADVISVEFIDEGESVTVNGQLFEGPLIVARKSVLKEISLLPLGADDTTENMVTASAVGIREMEIHMDPEFKKWLIAMGHDVKNMSKEMEAALKKTFDHIQAANKNTPDPKKKESVPAEPKKVEASADSGVVDLEDYRKKINEQTLEANRIATLCAGRPEVHQKAIEAGWDADRIQAEIKIIDLEAGRDENAPSFNIGMGSSADKIEASSLEIALLRGTKHDEEKIVKSYGADKVQASEDAFGQRIGIQEALYILARDRGYDGPVHSFKRDPHGMFKAAMSIQANTQFGTLSLPGLLSNIANKRFIDGFNDVEDVWREFTAIREVTDFKQTEAYSLTGDLKYKKVGPGGEIKSGTIGEEKYLNQADTYAIKFGINRTNLINDDLSALDNQSFKIGRGGALSLNEVLYTKFLDNAAFYTLGRGNLTTGAALSIAELTAMKTAFRLLKDPDGNPMGTRPAVLLTGVELETTANQLFKDEHIIDGTSTARQPNGNPHMGKYKPVSSAYISDTTIGGNATMSYLLANPASVAVIEAVFLNGVQTPTVETAQANFDTLGVDMRAWYDFGVEEQEYRGGVRSNGA